MGWEVEREREKRIFFFLIWRKILDLKFFQKCVTKINYGDNIPSKWDLEIDPQSWEVFNAISHLLAIVCVESWRVTNSIPLSNMEFIFRGYNPIQFLRLLYKWEIPFRMYISFISQYFSVVTQYGISSLRIAKICWS